MSKYVVISKLNSEAKSQATQHLHDDWPVEVREFDTPEAAASAFPDRKIYTVDEYKHFSDGLALGHKNIPKPKRPWWKFWGAK